MLLTATYRSTAIKREALLPFHGNSSYANSPRFYVIPTLLCCLLSHYHEENIHTKHQALKLLTTYTLYSSSLNLKTIYKCLAYQLNTFTTILITRLTSLKFNCLKSDNFRITSLTSRQPSPVRPVEKHWVGV
jgi:hypothetical protein